MKANIEKTKKTMKTKKKPAEFLVWTVVKTDDAEDLTDENIISMAELQENWNVSEKKRGKYG
jgi:hypothetical protein